MVEVVGQPEIAPVSSRSCIVPSQDHRWISRLLGGRHQVTAKIHDTMLPLSYFCEADHGQPDRERSRVWQEKWMHFFHLYELVVRSSYPQSSWPILGFPIRDLWHLRWFSWLRPTYHPIISLLRSNGYDTTIWTVNTFFYIIYVRYY